MSGTCKIPPKLNGIFLHSDSSKGTESEGHAFSPKFPVTKAQTFSGSTLVVGVLTSVRVVACVVVVGVFVTVLVNVVVTVVGVVVVVDTVLVMVVVVPVVEIGTVATVVMSRAVGDAVDKGAAVEGIGDSPRTITSSNVVDFATVP